ncbi:transmembrane protein 70, mitochondrial [Poeciliopsis prolifica]|uniref:transmembrane protein 70, mitochondrial n=1 Tax=Poeciliopsis prolifica TaxID=188132 RepID=UPI00241421B9|nr:transmembrane protein 70, mitochondrial [Poeciliopsis prolifica]
MMARLVQSLPAVRFFSFSWRHNVSLRTVRRSAPILSKVHSTYQGSQCLSTTSYPEDGNLVYTGNLGTTIRRVKMFSYSTSGASLILMPDILLKSGLCNGVLDFISFGIIGFFTFFIPMSLHFVSKSYVIRLYHNPDRDIYTAITYSVFLTEKRWVFHQSQVRIPAVSKVFANFYAGDMGLFVNPDFFPISHDYNHLMGYDKPFSFTKEDLDKPDKT